MLVKAHMEECRTSKVKVKGQTWSQATAIRRLSLPSPVKERSYEIYKALGSAAVFLYLKLPNNPFPPYFYSPLSHP